MDMNDLEYRKKRALNYMDADLRRLEGIIFLSIGELWPEKKEELVVAYDAIMAIRRELK